MGRSRQRVRLRERAHAIPLPFRGKPMSDVVLDPEQVEILRESPNGVRVLDESGNELGVLIPRPMSAPGDIELSRVDADELARRMSMNEARWLTIDEVLDESTDRADG